MNVNTLIENLAKLIENTGKQLLDAKAVASYSFKEMHADIAINNFTNLKKHIGEGLKRIAQPLENAALNIFVYIPITALGIVYELCSELLTGLYTAFMNTYAKVKQELSSFVDQYTDYVKNIFNESPTSDFVYKTSEEAHDTPNADAEQKQSIYETPAAKIFTTMFDLTSERLNHAVFGTYGSEANIQAPDRSQKKLPKDKCTR